MNDPKSGQILGNPNTIITSLPGIACDTIFVTQAAAGNDADVLLYFKGTSGNPKIAITDNGTTTNYSRSGSSWSGNHLSDGSYATYVIHADPNIQKRRLYLSRTTVHIPLLIIMPDPALMNSIQVYT